MLSPQAQTRWLNPDLTKRPEIKIGSTVKVYQKIKEGDKERLQAFEGLVIKKKGSSPDISITVRRTVGGIGIEKVIPLMGNNIEKIDIIKEAKVRRAKLYYMRDRKGKAARLNENYLSDADRKALMDAQVKESEIKAKEEAKQEEAKQEEAKKETTEPTPEKETKAETTPTETEKTTPTEEKEEKPEAKAEEPKANEEEKPEAKAEESKANEEEKPEAKAEEPKANEEEKS